MIGNFVFSGCSSLNSIQIPDSVTSIGEEAFKGCIGLKTIQIPESVKFISNNAFAKITMTNLENVKAPLRFHHFFEGAPSLSEPRTASH